MGRGGDFRSGLMYAAVNGERRAIQKPFTLNDVAFMTDPDEVRDPHKLERATHGIDPEGLRIDRVTNGDVSGDPFVKTKLTEDSQCRGEALLALQLLGCRVKTLSGHRCQIRVHHQLVHLLVHACSLLFSRQYSAASRANSPSEGSGSPCAVRCAI